MKDMDKIKEKKEGDEVKSTLLLIFVFLIIFGIITYVIINLTGKYVELKNKLKETASKQQTKDLSSPGDGKQIEYALKGDTIKVEDITNKYDNESEEEKPLEQAKVREEKPSKVLDKKNDIVEEKSPINITAPDKNKKNEAKEIVIPQKKEESVATQDNKISKNVQKPENTKKGNYLIQLMAFKNEEDAKNAVEKYKTELSDIFYTKVDLGEKGVWFRVRCCSSQTLEEVKSRLSEISGSFKINGMIVKQ